MSCEKKNLKKYIFFKFLSFKTKQNTEMSDDEHSDSGFYCPEEHETTERNASYRGRHFDKVEVSADTTMKS